jgi:hypothetical protein
MPLQVNFCGPACCSFLKNSVWMMSPFWSNTVAVTSDWLASRYVRVGRSAGVRTAGATLRPPTDGGGSVVPIAPVALRASGAAMAHV